MTQVDNRKPYASLAELADWARYTIRSRHRDAVIGADDPAGAYLRRWWVMPRNEFANVYLHQFLRSDDDRALHDHPWANSSYLLDGSYIEHMGNGIAVTRNPGDFVQREAHHLHRIELIDNAPCISLFSTGPKIREWGFECPNGWVHWRDFDKQGCVE